MHKGTHLLIDCRNVSRDVCLDDAGILNAMAEAARSAGATVISQARYRFGHNSPAGFTAVVLLDESHCSAHSYASEGLMAIDIFTCGSTSPHDVLAHLRQIVNLGDVCVREYPRFLAKEIPPETPLEVAQPLIPT
ncbi:MAG: adenosylmethionine decarboxylase [Planctomycetales bacterium]|nr:adenosylmethionine decarboxylase [Planctomycetales bacterium]NIM08992.1 adenosylmethionine decarboxylase [Planctomycetales bacterium]NIN08455.1 adenosylmethionine decarboxylase [Planctomycetales bacterium]NIN77589.1 adenosylmethionine decarboxylase [Planctomycetales bacterium]NIO34754.1 adenosylmethionine decarboxylase [Planctomycetales bacterium]